MIVKKSTVRFASELSYLNSLLKNYTGQQLNRDIAVMIYNRVISQIYTEYVANDLERYIERFEFPVYKSYTLQSATDVNFSYNSAYRILTLVKNGASWVNDKDDIFDVEWIGADVTITRDPGGDDEMFTTKVESIYDDLKLVLELQDPAIPSIFGGTLMRVDINSSSSINKLSEIDLSEIEDFAYLDKILFVSSDAAPVVKLNNTEFNNLVKSQLYLFSSFKNTIIWSAENNKLFFGKGSLSNYGNRVLHYKRKPVEIVSQEDYIDLPIEYHNVMTSRAVRQAFQHLNKPIPQFLNKDDIDFSNSKKAKKEEQIIELQKELNPVK